MPEPQQLEILIVEDDADTRHNLCDILALDNHTAHTANTFAEALNRSDWDRISVVILDRKLPDGTAEQVLPKFKELAPQAAVIIVTGFADMDSTIEALRQGASDYLLKPINPEALRTRIERVVAELRSEQRIHELATIVESSSDAILQIALDGEILSWNAGAEQMYGYSADEAIGMNLGQLAVEGDAEPKSLVQDTLAGDRGPYQVVRRAKDGRHLEVSVTTSVLKDPAGRARAIATVGRDVSALREAERRMMQHERLAAIGQMITGLAHESRNALQRVQACLEILRLEVEDRPEALDLVDRIQRAQDHLHHLFEEVRGYAAPIQLDREMCDLAHLWRSIWADLGVSRNGKQIDLVEQISDLELTCEVDAFALGQVIRNILENAIAACPEPGRIEIACTSNRERMELRFRDNGPGIIGTNREKVFEPFFTTKTKGTGLGMAIARRIVEAHGGQLQLGTSTSGAEFVIFLPREKP